MSDIIKKAGRPPNSKNKKWGIKLKHLCEFCNPETVIPLPKNFALAIKLSNSAVILENIENDLTPISEKPNIEKAEKIDFSVIDFNKP